MDNKTIIALPLKYSILLTVLFSVIILGGIVYFTRNHFEYQNELYAITKKNINGIIVKSKTEDRGFHYIEINDVNTNSKLCYLLPQSWFFKENTIQINDSVSKSAGNMVMMFYNLKNGVYKKCCDFDIHM
jgi:hypothetical protein